MAGLLDGWLVGRLDCWMDGWLVVGCLNREIAG
jgi:hypothetical protein